jgi:hypothetical protein
MSASNPSFIGFLTLVLDLFPVHDEARFQVVRQRMPNGELRPHKLTTGAVVKDGRVTYPGEKSRFT